MYAKLFASLYQGTLRGCADELLVFTNLLAHSDAFGVVDKHWRAIAEECGIPRDRVEAAIANLEAPDPDSRSPEEEGRRIVRMDEHRVWGWRIVNYCKYRSIRNEDDRREQNRLAQERWRSRNKLRKQNKQNKQSKPRSAQAEAEEEAKEERNDIAPSGAHPHGQAVAAYNAAAVQCGWPRVQAMNAARTRALGICLHAVGGIEGWHALIANATASDFLCGRTARAEGHANWRPDFDFVLKQHVKIMEGGYGNATNRQQPERGIGAVLAALADGDS